MAYIPGFEYDIFISYASVDNLAQRGKPRWVEQFHKELEIALAKLTGRMGLVKIWRDKRLEGNQLFDETIQSAIEKSALFLALTSNGYLTSDYCSKELQAFHKKAQAEQYGLQMGDRSRIYNALLNKIPRDKWPKEYARTSGYPLHDAEEADAFGEPIDLEDKKFYKQFKTLANNLYTMLIAFKEIIEGSATQILQKESVSSEGGPCVFISDVSDSLRTEEPA